VSLKKLLTFRPTLIFNNFADKERVSAQASNLFDLDLPNTQRELWDRQCKSW
jgi:hypothetical protein